MAALADQAGEGVRLVQRRHASDGRALPGGLGGGGGKHRDLRRRPRVGQGAYVRKRRRVHRQQAGEAARCDTERRQRTAGTQRAEQSPRRLVGGIERRTRIDMQHEVRRRQRVLLAPRHAHAGRYTVGKAQARGAVGGQHRQRDRAGGDEGAQTVQRRAVPFHEQHGKGRLAVPRGGLDQRHGLRGDGPGGRRSGLPLVDQPGGMGDRYGSAQMIGELGREAGADGELSGAVRRRVGDFVQQRLGRGKIAVGLDAPSFFRRVAGETALGEKPEQGEEGGAPLVGKSAPADERIDIDRHIRGRLPDNCGHRPVGDGVGEGVQHEQVVGGRHFLPRVEEGLDTRRGPGSGRPEADEALPEIAVEFFRRGEGDGPQFDAVDPRDLGIGGIEQGDVEGERARAGAKNRQRRPYRRRRAADGEHGEAHRQIGRAGFRGAALRRHVRRHHEAMEGRIRQRRRQHIGAGLRRPGRDQVEMDLRSRAAGGTHQPERRAVVEAEPRGAGIERVGIEDALRFLRRRGGQNLGGGRSGVGEDASPGVNGPFLRAAGPRADGDAAVGRHPHLRLDALAGGEPERGEDVEFLQPQPVGAQHLAPGGQRHLGKAGRGHDGVAADLVVGEEGAGVEVEQPAPLAPVAMQPDAEERMMTVAGAGQVDRLAGARRVDRLAVPRRLGQVDPPRRGGRAEETRLVHRRAVDQRGQDGAPDRVFVRPVLFLQGGEHGGRPPGIGEDFPYEAGEHRLRADLQEDTDGVVLRQRADGGIELHRLADVVPPVAGVERGVVDDLAGEPGDEGNGRGLRHQRREGLDDRLVERAHPGSVERVVDAEALADDALPSGKAQHRVHRAGGAGERDALRRVEGADDDVRLLGGGDELGRPVGARHEEGHQAGAARLGLQAAAPVDEVRGIRQVQRAGDMGGRDLADAVADHGGRRAAGGRQYPGERDFQREDERLGDLGGGERRLVRRLPEGGGERPAGQRLENGVDLVDGGAEAGAGVPGRVAHAGILPAIAGEDEGDLRAGPARGAAQQGAVLAATGDAAQLAGRVGIVGRNGEAVLQPRAAMRHGMGEALGLGFALQPPGIALRKRRERLCAMRRKHQHRRQGCGGGRHLMRLGKADDGMGVGAAEAEGGNAGDAFVRVERQRFGGGAQVQRLEVDMLVQRVEMQRGRQLAPLQRVERLQQPREPGSRFQMADIGLHRADGQRPRAPRPDRLADGAGLGRVADQRPRAMRLDEGEAVRGDAARGIEFLEQALLRPALRHGDAERAPVGIGPARHHHGAGRCAHRTGRAETAQDRHHPALGADIAVGAARERPAASRGREHAGAGEADEVERARQHVHARHHGGVDLPALDGLHRAVEGDQRGGAGRVDGKARAGEAVDVRNPVGDDGQGVAGDEMRVGRRDVGDEMQRMVERGGADEDADIGPRDRRQRNVRVLERLPHQLQQQALLRVDLLGLARGEAKGAGVEAVDVVEHARREGVGTARHATARMQEALMRPAVGRNLAHGAFAARQQRPERRLVRRARQTAGAADNGRGMRRLRRGDGVRGIRSMNDAIQTAPHTASPDVGNRPCGRPVASCGDMVERNGNGTGAGRAGLRTERPPRPRRMRPAHPAPRPASA